MLHVLLQTYNVDKSTSDSAATGTAYMCGVKANFETVGVSDKVQLSDCGAVNDETKVRSIIKDSISEGMNNLQQFFCLFLSLQFN